VDPKRYSLADLCALTEMSLRTVRFYIQGGLLDRPIGETRAAYYTTKHAEQLIAIRKWTDAGLSLERIGDILRGADSPVAPPTRKAGTVEVWSHLVVADGIEIELEPGRARMTPEQVRAFFREVMTAHGRVTRGEKNEK